jgi:hypothetical protein
MRTKNKLKRPTRSVTKFSHDEALEKLLAAANRITEQLSEYARKYRALEETAPFPEVWARQVRKAISSGLVDWAVRRMGDEIEKYLEEGVRNYLALFWLGSVNPYRDRPWGQGERFTEGLRNAFFLIPLDFTRGAVHAQEWLRLWETYRNVLQTIKKLQTKKRKSRGAYLLALRENLPGLKTTQIEKFSTMKPSDIAAEYVAWKFKLPAGPEALKEYFKVFHKSYGYYDRLSKQLASVR